MKNLLLLFSVFFTSSLSAVEYGYFTNVPGEYISNKVSVPSGSYLRILNQNTGMDFGFDGEDNLCMDYQGEVYKQWHYGNTVFPNKTFYGPCEVYLEITHNPSNKRYLPYLIDSLNDESKEILAIPANQNIENTDLIIQFSEDTLTWTNISSGTVSQTSNLKFFRLVLENISKKYRLLTIIGNPNTTQYKHFGLDSTDYLNNGTYYHLLNLNDGETFIPLDGGLNNGVTLKVHFDDANFDKQFAFEYSDWSVGEAFIKGPATLYFQKEGGPHPNATTTKFAFPYKIISNLSEAQLSGGMITIPAGSSTYTVKIQYSEDLASDWIDLQNGAEINSSNLRFYRLTAVAE